MNLPPDDSATTSVMPSRPKDRELSGRVIVVGMFVLGLVLASLLFVYFEFNTRPFRPLREALGREFRHSRPNVEGGRLKGRGANTLRVTMSVPFDPFRDDDKSKELLTQVIALSRQHQDLASFDKLEVNLIHFAPEKDAITKTFEWRGIDATKEDFVP